MNELMLDLARFTAFGLTRTHVMTKFSDIYPLLFSLTTTAFATVEVTGESAATLVD